MGQAMLPLAQGHSRATDALTETQLAVFEAIPARRRASVGDIALAANVSVPSCLAALTALESAGLVEGDERGWLVPSAPIEWSRCALSLRRAAVCAGAALAQRGACLASFARNVRSSGPAVDEPDLPSLTKTATARSP